MKVTIKKRGGSRASVHIPDAILRAAKLEMDAIVDVREEAGRIVIEPVRNEEADLAAMIEAITPDNQHVAEISISIFTEESKSLWGPMTKVKRACKLVPVGQRLDVESSLSAMHYEFCVDGTKYPISLLNIQRAKFPWIAILEFAPVANLANRYESETARSLVKLLFDLPSFESLMKEELFWIEFRKESDSRMKMNMDIIREKFSQFSEILIRKFHQKVRIDDYGAPDISGFRSECRNFMQSQAKELQIYSGSERESIENFLVELVQREAQTRPKPQQNFNSKMSPIEYEQLCAQLLQEAGWKTQLTKASGDQGVDIIAQANGIRLVVQCKMHNKPVGNKAVQETIAAMIYESATKSAVVSSSGFTKSAKELANTSGVILLHHDELRSLMFYECS